ncbi:MAG: leucine-rich repeat domain-containing protein [Clostridia bacterium]|nr:leucine-rich repeat domain-containing protein [Clostridia bacterium]
MSKKTNKSIFRFLLASILLLSLCFGANALAVDIDDLLDGATAVPQDFLREDESITDATIPDGVDRIESGAFYGCRNLQSVSLPNTLQKIGSYAFYQCYALQEVEIPASVALIEGTVFYDCENLRAVTFLGKAPVFAGSGAFWFAVEDIVFTVPAGEGEAYAALLPEGANIIESTQAAVAFDYTPAASDLEFDAATGELIAYYGESVRVDLPAEVRAIGDGAFAHNQLVHIVNLPEGVQTIGDSAFSWSGLQFIGLPESLQSIGQNAFESTPLREIHLPQGLTAIGEKAFSWCMSLTEISIPEGVEIIQPGTFEKCTNLAFVMLSASLPAIAPDAFAGTALADIDIPWDATRAQADEARALLAAIDMDHVSVWRGDPPGAALPEDYYYAEGKLLKSENIQEALLPHWNYYDDDGELNAVLGLGDRIFEGNTTLKRFYVPRSEQFAIIGAYAFANSNLEYVDLFDTITTIGEGAFQNCVNLTEINLPDTIISIGPNAFEGSGITSVLIPPNAQAEPLAFAGISISGIRISDDAADEQVAAWSEALGFPWYAPLLRVSEEPAALVMMPDTFTPNAESDFTFDAAAGTIEKYVGTAADIVIPRTIGGVEVKRIGVTAFSNLSLFTILNDTDQNAGIRSVVIPETVDFIEDSAFYGCIGLKAVDCYGPLTRLGRSAFDGCEALETVTFHNGLRQIDNYAFNFCSALTRVEWGDALDSIGDSAFHQSGLTGPLALDVRSIGDQAFWRSANLTEVHISERIEKIGNGAFRECTNLATICLGFTDANVFEGYGMFAETAEGAKTYIPAHATEAEVAAIYNKLAAYNGGHLSDASELILQDCGGIEIIIEIESEAEIITETEAKSSADSSFVDTMFVCVKVEAEGVTIDPAILGRYDVLFHADGTAALTIGGVEMPPCPWQDDGDSIIVDYFGTLFVFERVENGLQMNYYDTMLLTYQVE